MRYVDYRERLGLGFNDAEKTKMLLNKVIGFLKKIDADYGFERFFRCTDVNYFFVN